MHGWSLGLNLGCLGLLLLLMPGCDQDGSESPQATQPAEGPPVSQFDHASAGTIRGQVLWQGDLPTVPPLQVYANPLFGPPLREDQVRPNPNAPVIDPVGRGVANAVVFLRGVDPLQGRPWDHGSTQIEMNQGRFRILQQGREAHVGFVRQGASIVLVSQDPFLNTLRCSGAAFGTFAFARPAEPLAHRLDNKGCVELSSGCGYYWMRAYLFVDEHSYYTLTDAQGRFELPQVPPGRYQLVCWLPSWVKDHHDRDPETSIINRLYFRPPVEQQHEVPLTAQQSATVDFTLSTALFAK